MKVLSYESGEKTEPVYFRMADLPPRLKLSRARIFNAIKAGKFPAASHPTGGRAARWHRDVILAWESAHQN